MDTVCSDCVFAEWEGIKQSGCAFGRIEKFKKQGVIVTLEDNHEKLYARIVGRVCNTCRHPSTVAKIPARKWKEAVRKEVIPRIAMAVYVDDDSQYVEACRSLRSIHSQTVNPYEIILIYNVKGREVPPDYAIWFSAFANNIPWRVQIIKGVLTPLRNELEPADYGQSVDLTVQSNEMKAVYFSVCKAGYEYPLNYIEVIDRAINEQLLRFVALLPDEDGNGLFVQRGLHNLLQGNKKLHGCDNIIDKIQEIAQEEGTGHMIKRFEELVE